MGCWRCSRNTDSRTFISTLAPPLVFTEVNSTTIKVSETGITNPQQLFLCAITNSLVLDWMLRQKVATTLNMFYIYQLPVPRLTEHDPQFARIVERAAKLICTTPEFDDLAREVGLGSHANGATDPAERARLRAELDGLVAHLYGLNEAEFGHILSTFPLVAPAAKEAALQAYRAFAPNPADEQVGRLIAGGEVDPVEFKIAAIWNPAIRAKDGTMKNNIIETVASFMNSYEGGAVIVGVENATNRVVGIADDMRAANAAKPNRDGYELWLRDVIDNNLGADLSVFYAVSFHHVGGPEVCRIEVRPASKPAYVNDADFYIRAGNRKRKLSVREAMEYQRRRWGH